ncbi:serine hydrolase [Streptomyces smyrnaeus]|uniref:serine hydrolase n=1 Tax=Streptomyces smyrnaeus TaxID=1387713 RepID=UPI001FD7E227|nr:serine hydrolase [Streptomyces smyrnaeus]
MASGEQQHQEALVAGESPDRSERERSSGETTGSSGTVARPDETAEKKRAKGSGAENGAGTATQDGNPSKIPAPTPPGGTPDGATERDGAADGPDGDRQARDDQSRDGGDEGDERLKSAVAAWVAGDSAPADAEGGDGSQAAQDDGKGEGTGDGERAAETGDGAASSDLPVRPKPEGTGSDDAPAKGADTAAQGDAPTAMFGVLRREGDRAGTEDDIAAADRAERLTSAFFGAAKEAKDAEEADKSGRGGKNGKADGAGKVGKADAGGEGEKDTPAVDQATAVFRAPDVGRAQGPSGGASGSNGIGEKSAQAGKPERADKADRSPKGDEATKADGANGASGADGTEKTNRTDKAAKTDKAGRKGSAAPSGVTDPRERDDRDKGGSEESDAERTSQFVPLRSADEPRTPAKPATSAAAAASAAAPTAPRKPAASPSAPTANPWSAAPARPAGAPEGPAAAAPGSASGALGAPQAPPSSPAESEPERTRQQPMPGSPEAAQAGGSQPQPLDLLAQLTNSPPPPETPLRTLTRRVKIWTPLVLLLAVVFVVVQAVRPLPEAELSMTASETYTFEGSKPSMPWPSEGQAVIDVDGLGSFGSYGKQKPVPIASVAKVMTAYVILRDHPVKKGSKGKMIPVDQKAEDEAGLSAQNESTVKVEAGTKISQREAMDAIMIASANNVARLLARWDASSEKAFVKKMNAAAKDLGMTNTHYTDPSGLTASTVSTAADQVKLGKKVMESPLFREVVRQPQYVDGNGKTQSNWNRLVPMDGVVGIKTGTTTKAGGNLLFAAEKEIGGTKQLIIGAVLGQYEPSILDTVLAASKKLIDAGQDALTAKKVVKKGQVVGYVDDQMGGKTPVVATKDVTAVGWPGLKVKLGLTDSGKTVPHTAEPGTKVGTLTVGDGPGQVRVPVALQEELSEPGFSDKLTRVG